MKAAICALLVSMFITIAGAAGQVARPIVAVAGDDQNLLKADGWHTMAGQPADNSRGTLLQDNGNATPAVGGFVQTIHLNQTRPSMIIARAESMATNVSGSADSDYSLYLDIIYQDGTPLWGQHDSFSTSGSTWHTAEVRVIPAKPIKDVSVYLLLRKHSGKAQFRGMGLWQPRLPGGACMFDGQMIATGPAAGAGIYVRDVAAKSGFAQVINGTALGVSVEKRDRPGGSDLIISDTSGHDRAVTVVYTRPVAANEWRWLRLPGSRPASAPGEYLDTAQIRAGTGQMSRYPVAAVASGNSGEAIAIDLAYPAVYRLGFAPGTGELYAAFDIALTREKPEARVAVIGYSFDASSGFRGALSEYYKRFPDAFKVRISQHGMWMPFSPISKVQGWDDFGFRFKEGNDETAWDDAHDILTFRYTEPMTWWMSLPKDAPRTLKAAEERAHKLAAEGNADANALLTSGHRDADGQLVGLIRNEPWCDGVVWSMNSAPLVGGTAGHFRTKWSEAIQQKLYGSTKSGDLDGEYIDSSEGYVTAELDFAREHFGAMQTPLTFAPVTFKPAIYRGLIAFEYVRRIAQDCHARGKLAMANATPAGLPWLAPSLDVMGTETDWKPGGNWAPMSIEELYYRRAMCGGKPYCFLMNTDFTRFSHADSERYMKRCTAFGFFPGFFSADASTKQYFAQPELYNRDRNLFRKYVPVIRRLSEAGWRPVPAATCDNSAVILEQFGNRLFTVFNPAKDAQQLTITFSADTKGVRDVFTESALPMQGRILNVALDPEDVRVFEVPVQIP